MEKKKTSVYLPHHLIILILLRLPVKYLIRFKCVCKSWFSLISDPHFANSQFQFTTATHTRRIIGLSSLSHEIRSIDVDAWLNDDLPSPNLNFLLPKSYFPFEIIGSCGGFLFLYRFPDIYLWNPSTGFKKQIPVSSFDSNKPHDNLYGFGYDQSRDDYVLVVFSHVSSHLEVFSFPDNTWKEIDGTHIAYVVDPSHRKGFLFNGSIHWLAWRQDLELDVIIVFDLIKRKLIETPIQNDFGGLTLDADSGLWVFGETLSIWILTSDGERMEIWVFKDYKVHLSWNKTLVLSVDFIPDNLNVSPMYSTKNGEIIIVTTDGSILVKYNSKGQLLEHQSFCNSPSKVVMYTESLLSLPGDNE
ncbi:putative F-box domain, galactose oxidase/kelch, beta-propeller, F-box associated interaction [Medicago truncatula]|uniref:Putative F-box domain, galactose oxidase/kelch, beta-propeller, F-box associated interaction n=1 Tax=Medicago truncatula TaxID=3880 RepID=A0A396I367_MEDTR|nr:F-box/kelch-repeat protein At3g23880 [Medicago truncatula]RHN59193.1 putative F-box domain, galactose oxidase/kelch, beta-propeller, F-box associated interaction [Medicago truncatula]